MKAAMIILIPMLFALVVGLALLSTSTRTTMASSIPASCIPNLALDGSSPPPPQLMRNKAFAAAYWTRLRRSCDALRARWLSHECGGRPENPVTWLPSSRALCVRSNARLASLPTTGEGQCHLFLDCGRLACERLCVQAPYCSWEFGFCQLDSAKLLRGFGVE